MSKSGSGFILGVFTGAAIGSAIALLYAPDTGKNTRGMLSYRFNLYLDELNDLLKKLKDEQEKITSQAKKDGDKVVKDAKQRADDLIKEAETLLRNIERSKPD